MHYQSLIKRIERNQPTLNELTVTLEIADANAVIVTERKLAFPIDVSEEAMLSELANVILAFENDAILSAQTAELEKSNAHADELKDNLEGTTL